MKVLYIVNSMTIREGSVKSLLTLIHGMLKRGLCVTAVTQSKNEIYQLLLKWNVKVYVVPFRISVYPKYDNITNRILFFPRLVYWLALNFYSFFRLTSIARKCSIDLIHTNVSIINIGFKVAKYLKIPHIYHIREYGDKDFNLHFFPSKAHFERRLKSHNTYSICITRDIQKHHKLSGLRNSFVIYNGISHLGQAHVNYFKERYFLYVGRIEPSKGLYTLVRAYYEYFQATTESPVPLLIVGDISDADYYSDILDFIKSSGMSNYMFFLGGKDNVAELMEKALAIIIPSISEGFGRCMVEAMFNGCLVIGHNTGGLKEQFENGKAICGQEIGLRYETNEQLIGHLLTVSVRPHDFYNDMVRNASEVVNSLYTIEKYVDNVYCVYERVLKETGMRSI